MSPVLSLSGDNSTSIQSEVSLPLKKVFMNGNQINFPEFAYQITSFDLSVSIKVASKSDLGENKANLVDGKILEIGQDCGQKTIALK